MNSFLKLSFSFIVVLLTGCASSIKVPVTELHNKQIVELPTELHLVKGGKAPTVILLHGCGGPIYGHTKEWVDVVNSWGYNAVVVNSIAPRSANQICNRPLAVVTYEQRSADAYDVAQWIKKQEWATDKVGLIGFSHGGGAVLFSAESRYVEHNFGKQIIAAGVAFYPYCQPNQMWKAVIPVQIHSGTDDNWTPAMFCRDLAKNWKSDYYEYEGATHGFDMVGFNSQSFPDAYGKVHWLKYDRANTELARDRTKQFLDKYLK